MAEVRVRFFATFREASGCPESSVTASDLSGLLDALSARHGEPFERLVRDRAADAFVVLVNGRNAGQLRGLDTELADGDEVSLFPPVSGG
jgi:molybdopterin synthase sulfur carrier subunit